MMKKLLAAAVCGAFAASALAAMPEKVTIVYVKSPFNLQNMVMTASRSSGSPSTRAPSRPRPWRPAPSTSPPS